MTGHSYAGPILDAHFHLWDYAPDNYPWLSQDGLGSLRRDHLPQDYLELAQPCGVTASVHIEAGWRPDDPVAETDWLAGLGLPNGVGDRFVAQLSLDGAKADRLLEEQAGFERVVGIRDILTWHPDPALSRVTSRARMDGPVWRANFALLARFDLSFDLLMSPWQAADAHRLALDHPDTVIAINHCGSPFDRDGSGMARWREGLRLLASAPNVVIKISDPVAYDPEWTVESLREVILTCVETFGPTRAMFASDYPVSGLHIEFGKWIEVFSTTVASLSPDEQKALFHDTAARVYRLERRV